MHQLLELVYADISGAYCQNSCYISCKLHPIGGHKARTICFLDIEKHLRELPKNTYKSLQKNDFLYEAHDTEQNLSQYTSSNYVKVNIPVHELIHLVSGNIARLIVSKHVSDIGAHSSKAQLHMHLSLICVDNANI